MIGIRISSCVMLALSCCLTAAPGARADADDCRLFINAMNKALQYGDSIKSTDDVGHDASFRSMASGYRGESQTWSSIADQIQDPSIRSLVVDLVRNTKQKADISDQAVRSYTATGHVTQEEGDAFDAAAADFKNNLEPKFDSVADHCQ